MYKVIKYFMDLHDNNHPYSVGSIFPRKGVTVTEKRLAELAGSENKQGVPLIALVEEKPKTEEKPKKAPAKKAEKKTAEE